MYADYEFYKANWSGKVIETDYNLLARQAAQHMDCLSFGRLPKTDTPEHVQLCQCEIVDYLHDVQKAITSEYGVLKSETVADYRREFALPKELLPENKDYTISQICRRWLIRPTNYMYRGVC